MTGNCNRLVLGVWGSRENGHSTLLNKNRRLLNHGEELLDEWLETDRGFYSIPCVDRLVKKWVNKQVAQVNVCIQASYIIYFWAEVLR